MLGFVEGSDKYKKKVAECEGLKKEKHKLQIKHDELVIRCGKDTQMKLWIFRKRFCK